jgi:hypothetical protein
MSNTFNVTFEVKGILYLMFVVGLNGFGKFWSNPNVEGTPEAVTGTLTGWLLTY